MLGPSGASDLEVPILASEHQSGIIVLLGGVDISTRLEQCASDLLEAKERWPLACGLGWARASASVAV